ncbi:MAG: hypothetical protein ACYTEQ_00830 [Planctomycetota bacterium]|jgi:hypothetical protein
MSAIRRDLIEALDKAASDMMGRKRDPDPKQLEMVKYAVKHEVPMRALTRIMRQEFGPISRDTVTRWAEEARGV